MNTHVRPLHDRVIAKRIEEEKKPKAVLFFPTLRRKSRKRAELYRLAPGDTKIGSSSLRTLRPGIEFCLASFQEPRSNWKAKNISS